MLCYSSKKIINNRKSDRNFDAMQWPDWKEIYITHLQEFNKRMKLAAELFINKEDQTCWRPSRLCLPV